MHSEEVNSPAAETPPEAKDPGAAVPGRQWPPCQRPFSPWFPLGFAGLLIFVIGIYLDIYPLRVAIKPIAIAPAIFWLITAKSEKTRPARRWLALGLGLGVLGDAFLEIDSQRLFLFGLGAFLLGNLAYIVAFTRADRQRRPLAALPFLGYGVGLFLYLMPYLGKLLIPVAVYAAVISAMMWRASALWNEPGGRGALLGTILFAVSDSMIAINKFAHPFEAARYWIFILYWLAQWMIAAWPREQE